MKKMAPPFLGTLMSPQNPAISGGGVDVPGELVRGRARGKGSGNGRSNDITPFSLICIGGIRVNEEVQLIP